MDGLIGAIVGLVIAAVLAMVNAWLSGREKVAEGVRDQRVATYPAVWERTSVVSRWPRTDATRGSAQRLHADLRRWYYSGGGLYLSAESRERYEHLQVVLEKIVGDGHDGPLLHYQELMDAASWFRTGLTDDLQTRRSWNPIASVVRRRRLGADRLKVQRREVELHIRDGVGKGSKRLPAPDASPVHRLTADDETLRLPPPA